MIQKTLQIAIFIMALTSLISCNNQKKEILTEQPTKPSTESLDTRISLHLLPMQKQHQLVNMRDHLEAVQTIISLIAKEDFDKASEVAYAKLGSTTEMQLMCASFGNKEFENMGVFFHKQADTMSEVLKTRDKNKSLQALATTINSCVQCHATFRQ